MRGNLGSHPPREAYGTKVSFKSYTLDCMSTLSALFSSCMAVNLSPAWQINSKEERNRLWTARD